MLRNYWALTTSTIKKGVQFAQQQLTYLNKTADSAVLFPYGVFSNIPAGVLEFITFAQGTANNRVSVGCLLKDRPELEAGEVALYHPDTGAYIIWREGGNLEIKTDASVTVDCNDATINSVATVDVNCPVTNISGVLNVAGVLNANANMTITGTVTNNGTNIGSTHTHSGSPSAPSGIVSNTGAPL